MSNTELPFKYQEIKAKDYFNVNQYRIDLWNQIKELSSTYRLDLSKKQLHKTVDLVLDVFNQLCIIEKYWAYPSTKTTNLLRQSVERHDLEYVYNASSEIAKLISSDRYKYRKSIASVPHDDIAEDEVDEIIDKERGNSHYFEVLFVDNIQPHEKEELREKFARIMDPKDHYKYEITFASSFQDALIALKFNYNIQSVVIRYGVKFNSENKVKSLKSFLYDVLKYDYSTENEDELALILGKKMKEFRPELDIYYVTDRTLDQTNEETLNLFRRIFYRQEDVQEAHLSIRRAISERFEAPFFNALVDYSKRPTGVFHAMPISRGNSVFKSNWIKDMGDFYGRNIFLAETSATTGGLDSLLQPTGTLKKAMNMASEAFGSQYTYFATNGTSTANKIVLQGLIRPDDIVLIDRDCHKSHHYAMTLSGAYPVYLDSYPIPNYTMYGAVPLAEIKENLLKLKEEGRLDKVKMLILTNCTFDGLVYNVQRVMEEVLAIKPDMIFLWDEAWFAFARFTKVFRRRTAMWSAQKLFEKFNSKAYKESYENAKDQSKMVDPSKVKIRVYATQSTHKTLSSLRQGSMIHIWDEDFRRKSEEAFQEAYMTHTSTSANYQILASLDVGRRQAVFEGYELVEKSAEMSMALREKIINNPELNKYFKVLVIEDLIPENYRESGLTKYYEPKKGWNELETAWIEDEFVLDPTKINLFIGNTGVNGDDFKNKYLMDQFGIQVNKTTRNSVLFMANIGTTRSSVAYLTGVLLKIARQLDEDQRSLSRDELKLKEKKIYSLVEQCPPLPDFSAFHPYFKPNASTPEGDIRKAFFMVYDEENCYHLTLEECAQELEMGNTPVSASFVIPYPPGFPVLVPGQIVSKEILTFMIKLDVKEIHGYKPELGLLLFKPELLQ
ncbi:MAG: ornithine decarboxylase [Bacteroidia bacterium]